MRLVSLAAVVVVVGLNPWATRAEADEYGQPLKDEAVVKVVRLFDNPDDFLGKRVRVEGVVIRVDEARGSWVEITNESDAGPVRIYMPPVGTFFPADAKGKIVVAEGIFRKADPKRDPSKALAANQSADAAGIESPPMEKGGARQAASYEILASGVVLQ